ncbi:MAG: FAD-dependent oxidoreductase [Gemmatimonadaceae bacterium]|nr:FAD-dependent oxidoreductase [Gemmatimonadaceae bacterium]
MPSDSGRTTSVWMETGLPQFSPLDRDIRVNVCIVGAGIAGMTCAYLLARTGRSVVVIDDGPIAGGETGRTTAHLTAALDDRYYEIEKLHGKDGARIAAESHSAAIDRVENIASLEEIDCDFERLDGYLFLGGDSKKKALDREHQSTRGAGLDTEMVDKIPGVPFESGPALKFPRQAQFHPLKYLNGLTRAILRDGGKIYCGTHADKIVDGEPAEVTTADGHVITADSIIVATNTPVNDWLIIHNKQAAYRTYVIGCLVPKGSIPRGLYWDTPDPYHYIRLQDAPNAADSEILIVGGEDHKTGQADDSAVRFGRLEEWSRKHFPMIQSVEYRWSGQVMEPVDYMGYIGRNPGTDKHIFVATGDSGNGMTHGTIAGILLTDLVLGLKNPWAALYDPSRVKLGAASDYVKENVNVAKQYKDWLTEGDVTDASQIAPGEGAVMRRGSKKVAVYKDESGTIHERSAVCTHLYCIVDWNSTEKSWDCPCHGSRFDPYGKVINGPAIAPLQPAPSDPRPS